MPYLRIHSKTDKVLAIEDTFPEQWGSRAAFRWKKISEEDAALFVKKDIRRGRYKVPRTKLSEEENLRHDLLNNYHDKERMDWDKEAAKRCVDFEVTNKRPPNVRERTTIERQVEMEALAYSQAAVKIMEIPPSILEATPLAPILEETPEEEWTPEPEVPAEGDPVPE